MKDTKSLNTILAGLFIAAAFSTTAICDEATAKVSREKLVEPVFRVTKQETATTTAQASLVKPTGVPLVKKPHPLDGALVMANAALNRSQTEVTDYTAILVKRERIDGVLNDESYMTTKIRNEKRDAAGNVTVPFGVYLKFLKPSSVKGREVIYVAGENNGKLIAHEGGFKGKFTPSLYLDPNGTLAMMGQRYPIYDAGIENLCKKLIARGQRDRAVGMCQVNITEAVINQRTAKRIEVVHPQRKKGLDFHIARIFVDDEYQLPVRYEARMIGQPERTVR